jgi:menaquinone-dependent protoporphyrinogen oxidase
MSRHTVLLLFASTHGHTEKIATRIARGLEAAGADVDLRRADGPEPALAGYDAVVAGGSIHAGHHQKELTHWAKRHAATLNGMPTAFFSVSLTPADDTPEAWATARRYIDELSEATGWTPDRAESFAGALQYLEYDFFTRLLIRLMMRHGGHPTDASRDYDYTDWDAVDAFAERCAALLPAAETAAAP